MTRERQILFGCDDTNHLLTVMDRLRSSALFPHHIITAATRTDLSVICRSVTPSLIILCFRNLQLALDEMNAVAAKNNVPLLCLVHNDDDLTLPHNIVVFTCSLNQIVQGNYFASMINSILMLKTEAQQNTGNSLVENALQQSNTGGSRNMSRMVLELDQKRDVLNKVKDRISRLFPRVDDPIRAELNGIVSSIKNCMNDEKMWEDFKLYFVKTNPDFLAQLARDYPSLTDVDMKYCCYLKMNMTNDDIRTLLGINQESVRTHKYRLKKKLSLAREQSLRTYLQTAY